MKKAVRPCVGAIKWGKGQLRRVATAAIIALFTFLLPIWQQMSAIFGSSCASRPSRTAAPFIQHRHRTLSLPHQPAHLALSYASGSDTSIARRCRHYHGYKKRHVGTDYGGSQFNVHCRDDSLPLCKLMLYHECVFALQAYAHRLSRERGMVRKNGGSLASVPVGTTIPRTYRLFHCRTQEF